MRGALSREEPKGNAKSGCDESAIPRDVWEDKIEKEFEKNSKKFGRHHLRFRLNLYTRYTV